MSRFQNKLVVGGSDSESSDNENEYFRQEMVNLKYAQQCMYNATMYNVMMQNMMPCIPMPCLPAYGYPMPYPSMMSNRPVNHAMAAGQYYEKGGRSRQSRKSRSKGDGYAYRKPHHRRHRVVSRYRYYEPSSESDREDECIYTGENGVQACWSVNSKMTADKSDHTLRHLNPVPSSNGVKQQRLKNDMPIVDCKLSSPLQSDIKGKSVQTSVDIATDLPLHQVSRASNNSQLTSRTERSSMVDESQVISGTVADRPNLPSNGPDKQNAMVAMIECQQEKQTADVYVAVDQGGSGTYERDLRMGSLLSNVKSTLKASALPSVSRQVSDQPTETTVINKSDHQIELPPLTTAETAGPINYELEAKAVANYLPLSKPTLKEDKAECEASSIKAVDHTEATVDPRAVSHHIVDQDLPPVQGADDRCYRGPDTVHPQISAKNSIWGNAANNPKYLQSLHSLRKMWAEWETKYRPPPVSIYSCRGAGPN